MANPAKQAESVYSIFLPHEVVGMDPPALDQFIVNHGVRLIHFRALPCPVGLQSPTDIRRTHDDHSGCSNGFIYQAIGRVTCLFQTNQTQVRKLDAGFIDGSTVAVTLPRFYDIKASSPVPEKDRQRVLVRPYDRFFLEEDDIRVGGTAMMTRRNDGRADRPPYPALAVHLLVDSDNVYYFQGTDFELDRGDILWADGHGPAAGKVYSAWFEYKPYWYCDRLVHEIRVAPKADFLDGNIVRNERMSFGAILVRENVHRDKRPDLLSPDLGGRQQQTPDLPVPAEPGVTPDFG